MILAKVIERLCLRGESRAERDGAGQRQLG
jgi:hypothetical protein